VLPDAGLPGQITVDKLGEDGKVDREEILSGTVSGVRDPKIWVLVFTFYGRWFPQSFAPCEHQHTILTNGQWKAKAMFGDDDDKDSGQAFDVVIVLADAKADATFDTSQWESCQKNRYPSWLTIELPEGLSVKYHTRVVRK
jgi:hypothetical protein